MIAADTSSLIAYLAGLDGPDIDQIELAIATDQLRIPPPVISEMLTQGSADVEHLLATVPKLPIDDGFWERAGRSRALVRSQGFKANLPDTLIAQCCIDAGAGLIARNRDYSHFAEFCGLTLAV